MKYINLIWLAGLFIVIGSCKKYNQIDNNSTVKVPFVLYTSGEDGLLERTNDGFSFNRLAPSSLSGKFATRGLHIADTNIIQICKELYTSNGKTALRVKDLFVDSNDQNMSLYDAVNKRVYVCGKLTSGSNDNLIYSEDNGETWLADGLWDPANTAPKGIASSITQTTDGSLFYLNDLNRIFKRQGVLPWVNVPLATTIDSLPALVAGLSRKWFLASYDNNLVLLDIRGNYGAYRSLDGGVTWKFLTGLPLADVLFAKQVAGTFFVGTKGAGIWRLNGSNFDRTDGGMLPNINIHGITHKTVVYRTDASKSYFFVATNAGLYRSENNAIDWVKLSSFPITEIW